MPEAGLPNTPLPHLAPHTLRRPGEGDDSIVNWIWYTENLDLEKRFIINIKHTISYIRSKKPIISAK